MKIVFLLVPLLSFLSLGCASSNKHLLRIDTSPPDALVSVHESKDRSAGGIRKVAGTTPVEKPFEFPRGDRLWLEIEKRGYTPQMVEVSPETKAMSLRLERAKDQEGKAVKEYSFPTVRRLLLARLDVTVIRRGFSEEVVSEQETSSARSGLTDGVVVFFSGKYEVAALSTSPDDEQLMKSVWRDARTAMELIDPIRLKYQQAIPRLETKSSREAVRQLGQRYESEVLLLISGKQNFETAGMKVGKTGITAAGTMASYGRSYANAAARGDSFFVYTVYIPQFSEGTLLKAILIECGSGEIIWANGGLWGPFRLDDPDTVNMVTKDLLAGL